MTRLFEPCKADSLTEKCMGVGLHESGTEG